MSELLDKNGQMARNILTAFAESGFKKTSMEGIAQASGISRQSVYKRFKTKANCYEWTIDTYLSNMYRRIFSTLNNNELSPEAVLDNVFDILIGEAVEIIQNTNGAQVLNDVLKATHTSEEDWPLRFKSRLADFIEKNGYASSEKASGVAFALISAGKGLLLEEASRESFHKDMKLIIKSVCTQNT